jgi:hypothetical protein
MPTRLKLEFERHEQGSVALQPSDLPRDRAYGAMRDARQTERC